MSLKVLVCGGGNGAHVLAGLAASKENVECRVLSLYENEAEIWRNAMVNESLTLIFAEDNGKETLIQSRPEVISKDPATVVPGADIIVITVPAFSHKSYLSAIGPYITSGTIIVGLPGKPGFQFEAQYLLKEKVSQLTIISTETLPWACRILEYGKQVKIHGIKKGVKCAMICENDKTHANPLAVLQSIVGAEPIFTRNKHPLEFSLMFGVVHPGLMYGKWKDFDGKPLSEKPLFYQGADDVQAKCVDDLQAEILQTAREITRKRPHIDLSGCVTMTDWLLSFYGAEITDSSSLKNTMATNKAYDGLTHPMKEVGGGYVPDFKYRYLSEDIPFGLAVTKGLAQIAGVDTPKTDEVITWAQNKLGKEYIVGSKINGKHVKETRAPQAFGITSLDDLDRLVGK